MHTTRPSSILACGIASILAVSSSAFAADWIGGTSNDWNDGSNWVGGVVPAAGVDAYIGILGGGNPPFTATISADVPQVKDILVARGGGPAILNHTAGTAATGGGNWLDVGTDGGTGTYNLANTAGVGGTLTGFAQGTGSVTGERIYVGGVEFGGGGGTGVMNINTSGTVNALYRLIIGEQGTGTVNLDNGTINIANDFTVGFRTNGANTGNGTFNMSGGIVNRTGGWTTFGRDGSSQGHFNMSGGIMNAVGETIVGLSAGASGTFTMSGGTYNAGDLQISRGGGSGTATINHADAIMNAQGQMFVGNDPGSVGVMTVSAGTVNVNSWLAVGRNAATGTLTISGGEVNQGITDAGSSLELTNFDVGGTGTVHLNGGSVKVNRIQSAGGVTATAIFNFNGGTLKARVNDGGFMGGLTRANVRDGGAKIDTEGFNITIAQALEHSNIGGDAAIDGGLTKSDNGALTLSGTSSYTGSTEIDAGALFLTGVLSATSAVNVDAGAMLGGTGTINSAATVTIASDGILSPGLSPGILSTGSVSLASGSDFVLELNGSLLGTDYDNLNVTGGVSLGSADLFVTLGAGFLPTAGETFTVVSNDLADPILGLFAGINGGAFGAGNTFSLTNDQGTFDFILHYDGEGAATTGGNDVVLEVVPEPGVAVSLLGGLGVLLGLRRRRA